MTNWKSYWMVYWRLTGNIAGDLKRNYYITHGTKKNNIIAEGRMASPWWPAGSFLHLLDELVYSIIALKSKAHIRHYSKWHIIRPFIPDAKLSRWRAGGQRGVNVTDHHLRVVSIASVPRTREKIVDNPSSQLILTRFIISRVYPPPSLSLLSDWSVYSSCATLVYASPTTGDNGPTEGDNGITWLSQ